MFERPPVPQLDLSRLLRHTVSGLVHEPLGLMTLGQHTTQEVASRTGHMGYEFGFVFFVFFVFFHFHCAVIISRKPPSTIKIVGAYP